MTPSTLDLTITRTFSVPREAVWLAWTNGDRIRQWSCPKDFEITLGETDLRVGGTYRCVMVAPDGTEHIVVGEYKEMVEPEKLVMTHAWENDGEAGPETIVTVHLADNGDGTTTMMFHQTGFLYEDDRDGHRDGWNECFDKLEKLLS
ncbi:MAG: polyketide cyclase [Candidatus Peribacteria bacterium]|nr:polyketide cyclase [Candidatus Peribacteria bacterium]